MGVKLTSTYKNFSNEEWKVDVIDTGFSGTATEFDIETDQGVSFEYDGETLNPVTDGIRPSIATFGIVVSATDSALNSYLESIVLYTEQKLFCNVYLKVSGSWVLKWRGVVNQTGFEFPDVADYTFQMTANDGLVILRDTPFNYATEESTPQYPTLLTIVKECLKQTGSYSLYGGSDPFIASSLDYFASNQRELYDMLFDTRVSKQTWLSNVDDNIPMTCYDVLERIVRSTGSMLLMWNGRWNINKATNFRSGSLTFKLYSPSGTFLSNSTYSPTLTFPIDDTRYPITEIQYTFDSAYARATVNWNLVSKLVNNKQKRTPAYDPMSLTIESQNTNAPFNYLVKFDVNVIWPEAIIKKVPHGTYNRGDYYALGVYYKIDVEIKCGGYYLASVGSYKWGLQNKPYSFGLFVSKTSGAAQTLAASLAFPPPPTNDDIVITIKGISLSVGDPYKGATTYVQAKYGAKITAQQVVPNNDNAQEYEDERSAYTDNDATGSLLLKYETDIYIGDCETAISLGGMEVYNGTNWAASTQWHVSGDNSYYPFLKLYTRELMRVFKKPLYRCTGPFFLNQTFDPLFTINWRSRNLFFNSGRFATSSCVWDAEFVQVVYTANSRPVNASRPDIIGFQKDIKNQIRQLDKIVGAIIQNVDSLNNNMISLRTDVKLIEQTRSLNADKYLLDTVEGLSDAMDIGAKYPLKAEVTADGVKLIFDTP